jgi:hypothetical protein
MGDASGVTGWTVAVPGQMVLALALAIAVYVDALWFGRRHGWERGFPSLGPFAWAIFVLLLWVVAVPWYVIRRIRLTTSQSVRDAAVRERREQLAFKAERDAQRRSQVGSDA